MPTQDEFMASLLIQPYDENVHGESQDCATCAIPDQKPVKGINNKPLEVHVLFQIQQHNSVKKVFKIF